MKSRLIIGTIILSLLITFILVSCSQQESIVTEENNSVEYSDLWLSPSFIQKNNEWFYYTKPYGGQIYKIKQNGKEKVGFNDLSANSFLFIDDYIYYTNMNESKIYRYKLDGSEQTILTENAVFFYNRKIVVMREKLYYQNPLFVLNMINLNGSDSKCIASKAIDFCIDEEWIYYIDNFILEGQELFNLHRMQLDGTENETIVEGCAAVDYNSDYVFYIDQSGTDMYRMKINGSDKQKLADCTFGVRGFFKVIGDWIYFGERGDNQGLYKVDINGDQLEKVNDYFRYEIVNVIDNWLVCLIQDNDTSKIIMIKVTDLYSTDSLIEEVLLDILPNSTIYKFE